MNKNSILITLTLAASLFGAGCNKSGKLDQTSTFKPPAGPMEFKMKWPAGERVVHSIDMKMNSEISVPNQPNPIKQDVTMGQEYALTVLKDTPGGGHELELEFLTMRMTMVMGGRTMMDYDSTKKPADAPKNSMNTSVGKIFKDVIGAKIQYFMDASNQVERIEGVDALISRLGGGGAGSDAGVKAMFNEGYLKQMVSSSQYLPPKAVQPGDTWPVHVDMAAGPVGDMSMDFDFTFKNWETRGKRTCARMELEGTIKSGPGTNAAPMGMTVSIQDGNASGVSWFDPELGLVIESDISQDMKMIMSVPIKMRGNTINQTMTNQMHQTITVKLASVK